MAVTSTGHSCAPIRATAAASRVTALSGLTCEPWPARPWATSRSHDDALLGGLQQVRAAAAEVDREAADLADRLGDALEQLGVVVDGVVRAVAAAGLLVGEEGEDDVARRPLAVAEHPAHGRQDDRVHVLHVDGAAAPEAAVALLAGERVDLPVRGAGRDDVQVAVHQQRRPRAVRALDAGDQARPAGCALEQLGSRPTSASRPATCSAAARSPGPRVVAVVRRVDPDEVAADLDDLVLRRRHTGGRGLLERGTAGRGRAWTRRHVSACLRSRRSERRLVHGARSRPSIRLGRPGHGPRCTCTRHASTVRPWTWRGSSNRSSGRRAAPAAPAASTSGT